ncbi:MAG: hypothetical protein AAF519_19035 [Bacteroidota bacterium]
MEVEIFTLSDYAENFNGKLTIVGTFDAINSSTFPVIQPICALSLRLRFSNKETGNHIVIIRLIDKNGKELNKIDGNLTVMNPMDGSNYSSVNLVMRFNNLKFEAEGQYSFELLINDEWLRGLPLKLIKANQNLKAA